MAAIIIAFGHSLLSMSGFETLAQVYREIASPKLKNLKIAGNLVCIYAAISTGVITLLATMIMSRLRKEFGVELPLRSFFESPTVSGLALNIAQRVIEDQDEQSIAQLLASI